MHFIVLKNCNYLALLHTRLKKVKRMHVLMVKASHNFDLVSKNSTLIKSAGTLKRAALINSLSKADID